MNREIKYKVFDKIAKKMHEGNSGFHLFSNGALGYNNGNTYDIVDKSNFEILFNTGAIDKNRKEIYEGDLCSTYNIGEPLNLVDTVVFEDGSFLFKNDHKLSIELRGFKYDYIEIIGNIYQNPELIPQ